MSERLQWLLVGCSIGFILGYAVRSFYEIHGEKKRAADKRAKQRDEVGFTSSKLLNNIALVLALGLTMFATLATAQLNNELQKNARCNGSFLKANLDAESTRARYFKNQVDANIQLQKEQSDFLEELFTPGNEQQLDDKAAKSYLSSLRWFIEISKNVRQLEPYPTVEELQSCYDK